MSGMDRQSPRFEPDSADSNAPQKNNELPEFREYVRMKYSIDLEEDLVTMMEDLIARQKRVSITDNQ
jgi:hypothetical protein